MNLTAYEIALIGIGGTVIGTLLGTLLTFIFSLRLAKINGKRLAGQRLRDAFMPELSQLGHSSKLGHTPDKFLESAFLKHQMAVDEFRFFLAERERPPFNKAWKEYYADNEGKPFFAMYSYDPRFMAEFEDCNPCKGAIKRIKDILKFTEK